MEMSVTAMTTRKSVISAVIKSEKEIQNGLSPSELLERFLNIWENIHDSLFTHALHELGKLLYNPCKLVGQNGDVLVCFANDSLNLPDQ
jgi:hypothetical protein